MIYGSKIEGGGGCPASRHGMIRKKIKYQTRDVSIKTKTRMQ
jgi:hypothetical protein